MKSLLPELRVRLFGQMTISRDDEDFTQQLSRKTRALLAYLAATDRAQDRRSLHTLFCQNAKDPASTLRWHLSRIRRLLGPQTLVETAAGIQLASHFVWVDSRAFCQALAPLEQSDPEALPVAVTLYRGEFLADLELPDSPEFELWLLGQRAHHQNLAIRAWRHLANRAMTDRHYDDGIHCLQQLLQHDPLLEEAHARLIWLYAQSGQRQAALRQYEICCQLLMEELAVGPTPQLQAVYQDVLSGRIRPLITAASATVSEGRRPSGDFVSRQVELSRLDQLWLRAGQGQGSVILIEAAAGGGKTRLVQEFAARNLAKLFLVGQCYESTRGLPYHPWLEIMEKRVNTLHESAWHQFPRFWLERLAWLFPPLAVRLGTAVTPPRDTGGEVEQLFLAITHLLFNGNEGDTTPLLLFLDDLQWADEASLHLFHFLALRIPEWPVLLIGAFRTEEVHDSAGLRALLHDLPRTAVPLERWQLPPLPPEAITELMAQLWPQLQSGYRPYVSALLAGATGGNPFFLTELLFELAHSREIPSAMPVPSSVQDLVQRLLERLPESGRQVSEALAILNAPVTLRQVRQVSGRSEDEAVTAVDLGLRQGLLQTIGETSPTTYAFAHDLVSQAVVSQLSDVRRKLLHRRCAAILVQEAGRPRFGKHSALAGRIARHAWHGEAFDLVWQWAPVAAEQAMGLYAYGDALSFYEMALGAYEALTSEPMIDAAARQKFIECLLNCALLDVAVGHPPAEQQQLLQRAEELWFSEVLCGEVIKSAKNEKWQKV